MNMKKDQLNTQQTKQHRPVFERNTDAYINKEKLADPSQCPQCDAVYHEGRWRWDETPKHAKHSICPACHRINDKIPAGFVTLEGTHLNRYKDEIIKLIQHHVDHQRAEHPLKRIMSIESKDGLILITTTDRHLAEGIGKAVMHAHHGQLKVDHVSGEDAVYVYWHS